MTTAHFLSLVYTQLHLNNPTTLIANAFAAPGEKAKLSKKTIECPR